MNADDAHLSIDQLADLTAEVTPPDEISAAVAHVRSCDDCRGTYDLLAGVPALLAGAEAPPMPPDVTARVVAAIERERISRSEEAAKVRSLDAARSRTRPAGSRRRLGARLGAGLLGAAAVLGGGYLVLSGTLGDLAGESSPMSGDAAQESAEDGGLDAPTLAEAPVDDDLGIEYSSASLDEEVERLLASTDAGTTSRAPGTVLGEDGKIGEPDDVAMKACVAATQRRAGSAADPLAVDFSTYEGEPAVVIVLPDGSTAVDVWVLGQASCVAASVSATSEGASRLDVLRRETLAR